MIRPEPSTMATCRKGRKRSRSVANVHRTQDSCSVSKVRKADLCPPVSDFQPQDQTLLERELRMLQSLIPEISSQHQLSELQIIDASVSYIEHLQNQLKQHIPGNWFELSSPRSETSSDWTASSDSDIENDSGGSSLFSDSFEAERPEMSEASSLLSARRSRELQRLR